ncbi:MAG: WYL domain-containing protein [Lachnospiraceae bacterium]|nr:WYL domain-containing protein [Lachnospiraceae bacterium]
MPKAEKQKQKLLYIIKLLQEKSDENHPVKMEAILAYLDQNGIGAERKSIYNDMDTLRDFGYDIELIKGKNGGYYLASRDFESAELKVLVDAIQASRFIPPKKSKELIGKIAQLAGEHEAKSLKREVYVMNRIKAENESIYYNVDDIYRAIDQNVQITFKYLEYSINKETRYRKNGKLYVVSPRALAWNEEKYYLIAYDPESGLTKNYRVDKMKNITVTSQQREFGDENEAFDVAKYCNRSFGMYSGEGETVVVSFPNHLIGVVIDRFGKEVTVHKADENLFTARINVAVSQQFYGWLTGLGSDVRIVSPESVADDYKNYLKTLLNGYK